MRKNRIKLSLIIASLCGTCGSASTFGQDYSSSGPISSVGRIGDGGVLASTTEASLGQDARPAAFRSNVVSDTGMGSAYSDNSMRFASYGGSVGNSEDVGSCSEAPCGTGSCSSGRANVSSGWFESETLLWWPKSIGGGPLVVRGNNATERPSIPVAGGDDNPIGNDLLVGMRLNMGVWTDCNQNFGIGARGWGILSNGATTTYGGDGNSNGIPFFNASLGPTTPGQDVFLVNVSAGSLGADTGTIQLKSDVDLVAGELYGRSLLMRDGNTRLDLLTGYTFARLDSELGIQSQVRNGITDPIQNGTVFTTQDTFGTKNQFHGGHVGFLNEFTKGRFTFSGLGKVALGNMNQSTTISGQRTTEVPNQATITDPHGFFARSSNIGTLTRNQFTFVPEAGAKVKYQLGQAQFGLGYTLMVFPSVAMAGDQVDRNVDVNPFVTGSPVAPSSAIVSDTFFLHGLDLGLTFSF